MYIILVAIMKIVAYVPAYNELLQMSVQYTYYRYSTARHPDLLLRYSMYVPNCPYNIAISENVTLSIMHNTSYTLSTYQNRSQ